MDTITVTLRKFKCVCEKCRHQFVEADFTSFDYGRRLLRTISGKHSGIWIGPTDASYYEFKRMMQKIIGVPMAPRTEAKLFDKIFGISCDPLEGEPIDASLGCVCPRCGSWDVDIFDIIPKQTVEKTLPLISHIQWQKKTLEQKEKAIRLALELAKNEKIL